ncbi:hypothetical protein [Thiorhodovibrio frisius]|uniref:Uncharacterized protein n=1 Tax=Thiorhodovibrio frisius TaxID=631362 RepID=H8YYW3_9GAMM|nr:hypothetical protein [Thiorhodovibrio frisius]EIC23639.1 hypothetical protein Thi970DRAFT_01320 [Thiorhodovibrio frisius]WPL23270.1 hypothetical protein Thiofri_03455 [Thiorhodovibrio frisius]
MGQPQQPFYCQHLTQAEPLGAEMRHRLCSSRSIEREEPRDEPLSQH